MKRSMNWRALGIAGLVCLPAFVLVVLLAKYAVNVPFWDQWELVALFEKWHAGTLGFADFFAQHNEHRVLFPRLIMFGLAVATGWNTLYEVAMNVVLAALTFWFLWQILRATFTTVRMKIIAAAAVSAVVFSPLQFENWMWGWQIQWFLNVLGLVVAVWALSTWRAKPWARFAVAAIAATVATYSLASGFFVWLVCVPLMWFAKDLRRLIGWWALAAAIVIGSHYIGYVDPSYHPSKLIFLKEPLNFIMYFLVYAGRPLIVDFLLSIPIFVTYAAVYASALVYTFKKHKALLTGVLLPWLSLGLYGLFAAGSTSISRLGFGVEQAYSSRYSTLSSLLLVAGIVLLCKIIEQERGKAGLVVRRVTTVALAGAMLLVGVNFAKGVVQMQERNVHLTKVQACAQTATSAQDNCLLLLYPNKDVVWERLEYLRSIHWGGL
jgi:hypothetical protein